MNRFEVIAGKEFDVTVGAESYEDRKARVQERLTYLIFGALILGLLFAAVVGVVTGSYDGLKGVWSAAALPLGYILKAYYDSPGH
jgi:hypothetical protein